MADFALWLELHGFQPEVRFGGTSGKRRWRFDYQHSDLPIALEYHGKGVGHQSYRGVERDYEKQTEAALCGITVIVCSAPSVEDGRCHAWVEKAIDMRKIGRIGQGPA